MADPIVDNNRTWYIDICVKNKKGEKCFIELKYKTKSLADTNLKNQAAEDLGRYSFLKDVSRIEASMQKDYCNCGYTVFLSNDHLYWQVPKNDQVVDLNYRLHQNENPDGSINGLLNWNGVQGEWLGQHSPVTLRGTYKPLWKHFSTIERNQPKDKDGSMCNYLVFQVK